MKETQDIFSLGLNRGHHPSLNHDQQSGFGNYSNQMPEPWHGTTISKQD
jgi:hypothetical protein